jgi:hypothetical protein
MTEDQEVREWMAWYLEKPINVSKHFDKSKKEEIFSVLKNFKISSCPLNSNSFDFNKSISKIFSFKFKSCLNLKSGAI